MKRVWLILLSLLSSALAGGAEQNNVSLTSDYYTKVVSYVNKNLKDLPKLTDCSQGKALQLVRPAELKLLRCGILKKSDQVYIEVTGYGLSQVTVVPSMPANNPRQEADTLLKINAGLIEMHQQLGWEQLDKCFTASKICKIERESRRVRIHFESTQGIRLFYDGSTIHDWPK